MDGEINMRKKKLTEIGVELLDELYRNSEPPTTWHEILEKYADKPRSEFYLKHAISEDKYIEIVDRYKKQLRKWEQNQLSWLLLDYAPTCKKKED